MKVIYFSTDYSPHDHRFLCALAKSRHEVFFLRLERSRRQVEDRPVPPEVQQILWAGGRRPFRWRDLPRLWVDLRRVIRRVQPDLIHAGPIQTCAFLAVLSGFRPVLTMSWGFDLMQDAERNAWSRWVTRYTLRRSTFFVSDALVTRDRAIAYGMRPDRTAVFPWGVDLRQFKLATSARNQATPRHGRTAGKTGLRRAGFRQSPFVLLCNRSWEPRYGVDVLAKAFVEASRQVKGLNLILLGSGSQASLIRQILEQGGVIEKVQLAGQVRYAQLPDWYHRADLFVSPSHVDGSSVSLMEALACGLPVLVSDIPANKEWVQEGVNGWLYPDNDPTALAGKIAAIAAAGPLDRIQRAARRVAQARADWPTNFKVLLRSYERAAQLS